MNWGCRKKKIGLADARSNYKSQSKNKITTPWEWTLQQRLESCPKKQQDPDEVKTPGERKLIGNRRSYTKYGGASGEREGGCSREEISVRIFVTQHKKQERSVSRLRSPNTTDLVWLLLRDQFYGVRSGPKEGMSCPFSAFVQQPPPPGRPPKTPLGPSPFCSYSSAP